MNPRFIASTSRNDDVSFCALIVRIDLDQQSTFHYVDAILFVCVCVLHWTGHIIHSFTLHHICHGFIIVSKSCKISSISVEQWTGPPFFGNCGSGVNDINTFDLPTQSEHEAFMRVIICRCETIVESGWQKSCQTTWFAHIRTHSFTFTHAHA